ncbi:HepT-like ribonuclease domain-containing protein [Staphylothermus marinus]|uniref:HepT-like ribonuclease domain-containing protein n=1 Tax=Staphylothermus marinus TaxID=2280 RepID=UPI003CC755B7
MENELVKEIKGIVGLRNIVVHLYADLDYDIVLQELPNIINNLSKYSLKLLECIDKLEIDP